MYHITRLQHRPKCGLSIWSSRSQSFLFTMLTAGAAKERLFDLASDSGCLEVSYLTGRAAAVSSQTDSWTCYYLILLDDKWVSPPSPGTCSSMASMSAFETKMNELFRILLYKEACGFQYHHSTPGPMGSFAVTFQTLMAIPASTTSRTTSRCPFRDAICNRVQLLFHKTRFYFTSHCNRLA
jgi:hypothetical protein